MEIRPFTSELVEATRLFSDQFIGEDYFTTDQLKSIANQTQINGVYASFVLLNEKKEVKGFRLSFPPGTWIESKSPKKIHPELWGTDPKFVAYFQTIFLADEIRGSGWGHKLSAASIEALKSMGAQAIVCHSWKESPHNSSMRYLEKIGFKAVKEIPNYWIEVDYNCIRCGKPCLCTATEMVFYL